MKHWYQVTDTFTMFGHTWTTNGHVAYRGAREVPETTAKPNPLHLAKDAEAASASPPLTFAEDDRGHRIANGIYHAAHFLAYAESLFPGIVWRRVDDPRAPTVGYIGADAVAVVMPLWHEPASPSFPKCVECGGKGKPECDECEGCGDVEHECSCGMWHSHDCEDCNGTGYHGKCDECGGDGLWKPDPATAA